MNEGKIEHIHTPLKRRFAPDSITAYLVVLVFYVCWVVFVLDGFRSDHILFTVGVSFLYFIHESGRKLVLSFGFMLLYWFIFDSIRLFPNYEINPLHIAEPYELEKLWFGIQTSTGVLTPNQWWGLHTHPILDTITALVYLSWIPVPLTFSFWLFSTKRRRIMVKYLFGFLLVSLIGLTIQYLYPAAAPWYVDLYGFEEVLNTPGNPGRLINFDKLYNVSLFADMYSLNANVFAAIPSLHCAFPFILGYFAVRNRLKGWTIFAFIMMLCTWFSAVYTNHHYVIDVLLGIATGLLTIFLLHNVFLKSKIEQWLNAYGDKVS